MKYIFLASCFFILLGACSDKTVPQGQDLATSELIKSRNFSFKATTALPARGRSIQLTSDYSLSVKNDTIVSFLPYYGRAYSATIGRTGGGIEFTSTDFTYNLDENKNGDYEIEIVPKDADDVQRLFLSVSRSGYGTLHVTSQNRQTISFNGHVRKN